MQVCGRSYWLSSLVPSAIVVVLALPSSTARGGIAGFSNLDPSFWTYNQSDSGSLADLPDADTVHITSDGPSQARSIFYNAPQSISQFSVVFTYQALNAGNPSRYQGATFTLQNDPRGAGALGQAQADLGYDGTASNRIVDSAALMLRLDNTSGLFFDGVIGGGEVSVNPVNLLSGHPVDVTLIYDGFHLSETLFDTVTFDTYTRPNIIAGDLISLVGGPTAYVGFTASTDGGADQYISNFRFSSVPEPATLSLVGVGLSLLLRRRRSFGSG